MSLTGRTGVPRVQQEPQANWRLGAWQTASLPQLCNSLITSWLHFAFSILHL